MAVLKWLCLLVLMLMLGCKPLERIVEVPVDRVTVAYRDRWKVDSIVLRDSVLTAVRGDTVFVSTVKNVYKYKFERDTVHIVDTITVVRTVRMPVEEHRSNGFQWFFRKLFWYVLGAGALILIIKFI